MGAWVYRPTSLVAFVGLLFIGLASLTARGDETRLAISGYDPVAYFTDGKPVPGMTQFEHVWHDARWRFASAAHRDLLSAIPIAMHRNTMVIAPWAWPWRKGTRPQLIPRLG